MTGRHHAAVSSPERDWRAMKIGLTVLKYFPASVFGGLQVKSYASVFPQHRRRQGAHRLRIWRLFVFPNIQACGGLGCKRRLIGGRKWDEITALFVEAMDIYRKVRG